MNQRLDEFLREVRYLVDDAEWKQQRDARRHDLVSPSIFKDLVNAAGLSVRYASHRDLDVATRADLTARNILTASEVRRALRTLRRGVIRDPETDALTGQGFPQLRGAYALYLHPDQMYDLLSDPPIAGILGLRGFDREPWMDDFIGLVGRWCSFCLFESTEMPVLKKRTPSGHPVYCAFAFGPDAFDVNGDVVVKPSALLRLETGASP